MSRSSQGLSGDASERNPDAGLRRGTQGFWGGCASEVRRGENVIWVGRVAEKGNSEAIKFDGSDNFVALEVGKRGSGKSFGMGSILEGFATGKDSSRWPAHCAPRRALLLDPLDIHWTALQSPCARMVRPGMGEAVGQLLQMEGTSRPNP